MSKISYRTLNYPIVIKRVVDDLVFSIPDLGVFKNIGLLPPKYTGDSANSANGEKNFEITEELRRQIMDEIEILWERIEIHRTEKKWQPNPSTFKQSLQLHEDDYSLPEFVKRLNLYVSVSENTIRREIKRGSIRCYQTEGGHRRIPSSELAGYLARIELNAER